MLLKAGINDRNCLRDIIQIIAESLETMTLDSLWLFWGVIFEEATESGSTQGGEQSVTGSESMDC